ncbi:hypothetical protein E2C01_029761 [Portunus trituberculatus]|uniref:Uncharacterized protein n=1 Tax=Portunus trituberculatus TaxID=210409 RepID=A0A5B7EST9_PORTR|nr:hypothetical protein [Portunus trituberculatus]
MFNPFSTGTHIYHDFECDYTILFTLGRVYGGQKINGHSLHYCNPHMCF